LASESSSGEPLLLVVGKGVTVGAELSLTVGLIVVSSVLFVPLVGGGVIDKIGDGVSMNDGISEVSSDKKVGPNEGELVDVGELVEGTLEVVGLKDVVVAPVGLCEKSKISYECVKWRTHISRQAFRDLRVRWPFISR